MLVTLTLDETLAPSPVQPIVVWADGIDTGVESERLAGLFEETLLKARTAGFAEERRQSVRRMLRYGKFRATGRAKPASEFLLQAAQQEPSGLHQILSPVDINNIISLESGFPVSIFDAEVAGENLILRRGLAGESYVFNTAGHSIDLEDLIVVCSARLRQENGLAMPCGNPIKDSMLTKIQPASRQVIGVVYAPSEEPHQLLHEVGARFASLLQEYCHAQSVGYFLTEN